MLSTPLRPIESVDRVVCPWCNTVTQPGSDTPHETHSLVCEKCATERNVGRCPECGDVGIVDCGCIDCGCGIYQVSA